MRKIRLKRMPIILSLILMLTGLLVITLLYAQTATAGNWQTSIVDTDGHAGTYTSIALDSDGNPHISYYDDTQGKDDLRYAYRYRHKNGDGTYGPWSSWIRETVDATDTVGKYSSIAVDSSNNPHISYYDETESNLNYAYKYDGEWRIITVDGAHNVGMYTSLVLDSNGDPHISYYGNVDESHNGLMYIKGDFDEGNGGITWGTQEILEQETITANNSSDVGSVGRYSSIAVSSSSNPAVYISYYDYGTENKNLKFAYKDTNGWHYDHVDANGNVGQHSSIAVDVFGKPHISYYDATPGNLDLKYAYKQDGFWHTETVVMPSYDANHKPIIDVDINKDVGMYSDIVTDVSGVPRISYWDATNKELKYAYKTSTGWQKELVDTTANVGEYNAMALDSQNNIHISYHSYVDSASDRDLKYALKDMVPPTVSKTNPTNNATNVDLTITPTVTFSKPINIIAISAIKLEGTGISTSDYSIEVQNNILTIKPTKQLGYSTTYTVSIPSNAVADGANNVLASNYSFRFTTKPAPDVTKPTTSVNPSSSSWFTSKPTITLSASDNSGGTGVAGTYYYWNSAPENLSDWKTYPATKPSDTGIFPGDGQHTLYFFSIDKANNKEDVKNWVCKVDSTKPTTSIDIDPPSPDSDDANWYKTTPEITLTGADTVSSVSKIYYRWDERTDMSQWVNGVTPVDGNTTVVMEVNGQKIEGPGKTLYFYSVDVAGNKSDTQTRIFSIDTTPPNISTTVNPAQPDGTDGWYNTMPTITITVTEPYNPNYPTRIEYKWDNQDEITTYIGGKLQITGREGDHTLTIYAKDRLGNSNTKTLNLKVDTVPPTAPEFDPLNEIGPDNKASFAVSGITEIGTTVHIVAEDTQDNEVEVEATVLDDEFSATLPDLSDLENGTITFTATATDHAGKTSVGTATTQKDLLAPTTTIFVSPASPNGDNGWYKTRPMITLAATDTGSGSLHIYYKWGVDGVVNEYEEPFGSLEGEKTLYAYAVDAAGNSGEPAPVHQDLKVDITFPGTPTFNDIGLITIDNRTNFEVRGATDAGTTVHIKAEDTQSHKVEVDATVLNTTFSTTPLNLSDLIDGTITFTATSKDQAGNTSTKTATSLKDTTASSVIISPDVAPNGDNGWYKTRPMITLSPVEAGSENLIKYKWGAGGTVNDYHEPFNNIPEGENTLYAYTVDNAGNSGEDNPDQRLFKIDISFPTSPENVAVNAGTDGELILSWSPSTDTGGSGIHHYEVTINSQVLQVSGTSCAFEPTSASNTYDISIEAYDYAGNISSESEITYSVSNMAHVVPGNNVPIILKPLDYDRLVSILFSTVVAGGDVSIEVSEDSSAGEPSQYRVRGKYFNITTTGSFSFTGTITIRIPYDSTGLTTAQEDDLKLFHFDGAQWEDITVRIDKDRKVIIGETDSLSPFAVCERKRSSGRGSGGGSVSPQPEDKVPPAIPVGLRLVSNSNTSKIAWNANNDADLAGYNVYRKEIDSDTVVKLNSNIFTGTQYEDSSALRGKVYTYYVTAVDKSSNESPLSVGLDAAVAAVEAHVIFSDIPSDAWYGTFVSKLVSRGIAGGYLDGTFKPNKKISKDEFIKLICNTMNWDLVSPAKPSFKDVPKNSWAYKYVETAKAKKIISGYRDGTFRPSRGITRAEMARVVAAVMKLPKGSSNLKDIKASWAKDSINSCVEVGIITGYTDNTYRPGNKVTRAEAAAIVARMLRD